jgi:hypothetical protein
MNKFNDWYTKINEKLAEPVATTSSEATVEPTTSDVKADRDAMISDVDAIMHSLETLASELKEGLQINEEEDADLGDLAKVAGGAALAVGGAVALSIKLARDKMKAKKARKAQAKVNDMLMKADQAEVKIKNISDPKKKEAARAQVKAAREHAGELHNEYANKFEGSNIALKALRSEQIKGNIERIQFRAKHDMASAEDMERAAKLVQDRKKVNAEIEQATSDAEQKIKDAEEKDGKSTEAPEATTEEPTTSAEDSTEEPTEEQPVKNSKEDKLERLNALKKKAQEEGDEEKIKKIDDLISRVSAKESWQLEDTQLGILLEMEITRLEAQQSLNEGVTLSIKERFSKLI